MLFFKGLQILSALRLYVQFRRIQSYNKYWKQNQEKE